MGAGAGILKKFQSLGWLVVLASWHTCASPLSGSAHLLGVGLLAKNPPYLSLGAPLHLWDGSWRLDLEGLFWASRWYPDTLGSFPPLLGPGVQLHHFTKKKRKENMVQERQPVGTLCLSLPGNLGGHCPISWTRLPRPKQLAQGHVAS